MLKLQLKKGSRFEKVLEAILDLVNQASVNCSTTGFSLQALDTKEIAMLSLFFPSDFFEHYSCDEDRTIGISIADMVKAFLCASNGDIITIKADEHNYCDITLTLESPKKNGMASFDLLLVDAKSHRLQISHLRDNIHSKYQAIISMPSVDFMHSCKHLSSFGDEVVISVAKEEVKFYAKGECGCLSIVYRQNETLDKTEEATATHIDMREPVSLTFDLSYMKSFAKAFANQVTIFLSTTTPMMVEYKIEQEAYIRYFISPKVLVEIEEEEEGKTENE